MRLSNTNNFSASFNVATPYQMVVIHSSKLIYPRELYQRGIQRKRVELIARDFNEYTANEPKVSFRNGRYYVTDGQHTIEARILRNGGKDLPILCKVYTGLTMQQEALFFAEQNGHAAPLTAGIKLRAKVVGEDALSMAFLAATNRVGLDFNYDSLQLSDYRISCVGTALKLYNQMGEKIYCEALRLIVDAWEGKPDSFRAAVLKGVMYFVEVYHGEFNEERLIRALRSVHPMEIYRTGMDNPAKLPGWKKYVFPIPKEQIVTKRYEKENAERKNHLQDLQTQRNKAEKDLLALKTEVLACIKGESVLPRETLAEMITAQEEKLTELENLCEAASEELEKTAELMDKVSRLYDELISYADLYDSANFEAKKMIVNQLIRRVDVYRGYQINISFNFDLTPYIEGE